MSSSRDFLAATFADALLPALRRPVEDVIYETIDKRQIPTRTDFKELRDLVNSLRGQLTGATGGVKRLADTIEEMDERLEKLERVDEIGEKLGGLEERLRAVESLAERIEALSARIAAMEARPPAAAVEEDAEPSCKIEGCQGRIRARGLCARHYQQWKRGSLELS